MGYFFEGVFINDSSLDLATVARSFNGYAKRIEDPFHGIGVEFDQSEDDIEDNRDCSQAAKYDANPENDFTQSSACEPIQLDLISRTHHFGCFPISQSFEQPSSEIQNDAEDFKDDDSEDRDLSSYQAVKDRVIKCSSLLGDCIVAYIDYQTFAGPIDYCYGFACSQGQLIAGSEMFGEDNDDGKRTLKHVLSFVGVTLDESAYFEPFKRGYFSDTYLLPER